jgi:hypothetical protein
VIAAAFTSWQGLRDIRRDSPLLAELDKIPLPDGVTFTSLYSCADIYLWPRETARVKGATNVELCEHTGHFDGFWEEAIYERILAALVAEPSAASRY